MEVSYGWRRTIHFRWNIYGVQEREEDARFVEELACEEIIAAASSIQGDNAVNAVPFTQNSARQASCEVRIPCLSVWIDGVPKKLLAVPECRAGRVPMSRWRSH